VAIQYKQAGRQPPGFQEKSEGRTGHPRDLDPESGIAGMEHGESHGAAQGHQGGEQPGQVDPARAMTAPNTTGEGTRPELAMASQMDWNRPRRLAGVCSAM